MAGRQIGDSDGILIVPQGVRTISAIVIAKMQHNRSSFSRVLKQTMITPNRSRNAAEPLRAQAQESLAART
ncbi:hypothetical protein QQF64_023076 [Cirrhinus molitorella]|uniref:Uncharacterized protein n=1 Tax=Cirrhinus molitorella TaxID=172907 RepID=A0ABR3L468_9TELE